MLRESLETKQRHARTPRPSDVGNTTWGYLGFELASHSQDGDDYLFDITYKTDQGPSTLRDRFRHIDGEWKVFDLEQIA